MQINLLRVLEEKRILPLGSTQSRKVDVRILTATHQNLRNAVEENRFRADLLYRIRVLRVHLPPLRDRGTDLALLAAWFIDRCRTGSGKAVKGIQPEAMARLRAHTWPGNVRELKSAIEHAVIRCQNGVIRAEDLPPEVTPQPDSGPTTICEKEQILAALGQVRGNRSQAARLLGISRATFYRRLKELEIALK